MRITFVCPSDNTTGGMRVISIYAKLLTRRGHHVQVVIPLPPRESFSKRLRTLLREGRVVQDHRNQVSFFRNSGVSVIWLPHPGPVSDADLPDADCLIATWWETAEWTWAASPRKGRKVHFMQDYESFGCLDQDRLNRVYNLPIPKIVIAKWVWGLLESQFNQVPIALIHNSVDPAIFYAPPRSKQPTLTVGVLYSTLFNKGFDVSLAAIELASQVAPELRVVSFGVTSPSERRPVYAKFEFHVGVPDSELRFLYSKCDAWLFGTRREGFGLPILEAMACRTPVIGTGAGAGEFLIGRGGGLLVPSEDSKAMAEAILKIGAMPTSDWQKMSEVAYQTATSHTWDDAAAEFENALINVVTDH